MFRLLDACLRPECSGASALLATLLLRPGPLVCASLGGGPGTDAAGLAWALHLLLKRSSEVTLFDNERSWRRYTPCLYALLRPLGVSSLTFSPADVTHSLPAEDGACGHWTNKEVAAGAPQTALFLFSYVAHETAAAAAASGWAFYADVAAAAPSGALFLFADVRAPSASQVFAAIAAAMQARLARDCGCAHGCPRCQLATVQLTPPSGQPPFGAEVMLLVKAGTQGALPEAAAAAEAPP